MTPPKQRGAVLVDTHLQGFIANGSVTLDAEYVQPSSYDLPAGHTFYQTTCIPSLAKGFHYKKFIDTYCHTKQAINGTPAVLMPGVNYLVELEGEFNLPKDVYGYASPKSSAGRSDLDCTLLAEGGTEYNAVPEGYKGPLYLLITPQGFPVLLHAGDTLMQLRLFKGKRRVLDGDQLSKLHKEETLVCTDGKPAFTREGILLHLDLSGTPSHLVGIPNSNPVDLSARKSVDPVDYFREKRLERDGSLMLEPHEFVLATTQERLRIPPYLCSEMVPYAEQQGPFRSHFAGYFDPGFGYDDARKDGSGVVLEIRNLTNRRLQLADGQGVCIMRYELLFDAPTRLYGSTSDTVNEQSNYQFQEGVKLAKYFSDWQA